MRQTRYHAIADVLRDRIAAGTFASNHLLPSESELSADFGASRVTVRRALDELRDEGLIGSHQGLGWFVAGDPVRQSLGRLGTIEAQLAAEGVESTRRVLDFRYVGAPAWVRDLLRVGDEQVLRVRRLNLADSRPFALVTVWCPAELGAEVSRADVERSSFYELLDVPFGGATQTIGAAVAGGHAADLLGIPAGSPVLRCQRITRDVDGVPVLVSEHVFPAHLTEFVVDLPHADPSIAPTGLRLVD